MIFYLFTQVIFFVIYTRFYYKNHIKIYHLFTEHPHFWKVILVNSVLLHFHLLKGFQATFNSFLSKFSDRDVCDPMDRIRDRTGSEGILGGKDRIGLEFPKIGDLTSDPSGINS